MTSGRCTVGSASTVIHNGEPLLLVFFTMIHRRQSTLRTGSLRSTGLSQSYRVLSPHKRSRVPSSHQTKTHSVSNHLTTRATATVSLQKARMKALPSSAKAQRTSNDHLTRHLTLISSFKFRDNTLLRNSLSLCLLPSPSDLPFYSHSIVAGVPRVWSLK